MIDRTRSFSAASLSECDTVEEFEVEGGDREVLVVVDGSDIFTTSSSFFISTTEFIEIQLSRVSQLNYFYY